MKNRDFLLFLFIFAIAQVSAFSVHAEKGLARNLPIPENLGVNVHFYDPDITKHVEYLKKAGFCWVRIDFSWERIEKKKGEYDFTVYDKMFSALNSAGIRIMAILDYGNPNYDNGLSPASEEARKAFAKFAKVSALRYEDKNIVWEIYNEPNIVEFWKPKPNVEHYLALAEETTRAIIESVPDAVIVAPAVSGPRSFIGTGLVDPKLRNFLNRVFSSEIVHSWKAITIHPYRSPREAPESAREQIEEVRKMMREKGINPEEKPVIAGEWGYSTASHHLDEKKQAAYAVRSFLLAMMEKMPFSIWYNWQELGENPQDKEHKFGLVRFGFPQIDGDEILKPSFFAVAKFVEILRGYRFGEILKQDSESIVVRFEKQNREALVLWSPDDVERKETLCLGKGKWFLVPLDREKEEIEILYDGKEVEVNSGFMPVIVIMENN